jgi:hypothetical protein
VRPRLVARGLSLASRPATLPSERASGVEKEKERAGIPPFNARPDRRGTACVDCRPHAETSALPAADAITPTGLLADERAEKAGGVVTPLFTPRG